jgi:CBS domain-containing protein
MEVKRAGDIMIPLDKYPHIPHWFTMQQAFIELEHATFEVGSKQSLPRVVLIFDEEYNLLGLVRRRDMLRGIEPEFLANILADTARDPSDARPTQKVIELIKKRAERPVSDVMRRLDKTVNFDDNIIDVARQVVEADLSLLPVMKEGEVVGVVRTVELAREIARLAS